MPKKIAFDANAPASTRDSMMSKKKYLLNSSVKFSYYGQYKLKKFNAAPQTHISVNMANTIKNVTRA